MLFIALFVYFQVLNCILEALPESASFTTVVADYEAGLWRAVQDVLPDTRIQGCVFHWTQAVWRKIQALGNNSNQN